MKLILVILDNIFSKLYLKSLISLEAGSNGKRVHLDEDYFFKKFKKYNTLKRDSEKYPYEHFAFYCGVKFYCLSKE